MGFGVWGVGFGVWGWGLGVWGLGFQKIGVFHSLLVYFSSTNGNFQKGTGSIRGFLSHDLADCSTRARSEYSILFG